jgi:hypothetical protein
MADTTKEQEQTMNTQDRMLLGEAISSVGQCCHIIGAATVNAIIAQLSQPLEAESRGT